MGNTTTAGSDSFVHPELKQDIEDQYQYRGELTDPRFGKIAIYNHKHDTHQQVMFKQRWTNTLQDSKALHKFVQSRRELEHKNLTTLPFYEVLEERQMFSTFYRHNMGFEYYSKTLKDELQNRSQIQEHENETAYSSIKYYSESEIWYIINVLCSVVGTFRDHDYPHGDIQPQNLLIDNEGQMKIIDTLLINYGETGYTKMVYGDYKAPISPRLLEALKSKKVNPVHDKVKSDIWSIGMTALCASNNTDFNRYYDWRRLEILNRNPVQPQTAPVQQQQTQNQNQEILTEEQQMDVSELIVDDGIGLEGEPAVQKKESQPTQPVPQPRRVQKAQGLPNLVEEDLNNMRRLGYSEELVTFIQSLLSVEERHRPDIDYLLNYLTNRINDGQSMPVSERDSFQPSHRVVASSQPVQQQVYQQPVAAPINVYRQPLTTYAPVQQASTTVYRQPINTSSTSFQAQPTATYQTGMTSSGVYRPVGQNGTTTTTTVYKTSSTPVQGY